MADDVVIRAEGLGKKYLIGHRAERERYPTLRDVMVRLAGNLVRTAADTLRGRQIVVGDTTEEVWALKDVDFEIRWGEVVGIIGRNGAGKSTLLKVLSRITEPTLGQVVIGGRVASLLEVGTGFHPELTGRENIYLNGAILGMGRAEIRRKFEEIVAFADVERFLDTPVKHYSSGMYVRLAFAVAAHLEPEILVVDEVLAVGDAEFQKKCLGRMSDVARGGRTVLFVSHNMNSVEQLCGRVCVFEKGRMIGNYQNVREGVFSYLDPVRNQSRRVWRSGAQEFNNDYFEPEEVEVRSGSASSLQEGALSNKYPVEVIVSGMVKQTATGFNIGVAVYDDEQRMLLWTFTTDAAEEFWPRLTLGPIRLKAVIPQRLLNEGNYRIELLASIHNVCWIIAPGQGPSVTYSIQGGLSDSPLWYRKRPGLLGVNIPWQRTDEFAAGDSTHERV